VSDTSRKIGSEERLKAQTERKRKGRGHVPAKWKMAARNRDRAQEKRPVAEGKVLNKCERGVG